MRWGSLWFHVAPSQISVAVQQLSAVLIPYSCVPSIFRNSACLLCTPCLSEFWNTHDTHSNKMHHWHVSSGYVVVGSPLLSWKQCICCKEKQMTWWIYEHDNRHVKPAFCSFKILKSRGTQSMCLIIIIIIKQIETVTFWTCRSDQTFDLLKAAPSVVEWLPGLF